MIDNICLKFLKFNNGERPLIYRGQGSNVIPAPGLSRSRDF